MTTCTQKSQKSTYDKFAWVSREQIKAAQQDLKEGEASCCFLCDPYKAPGYIINANQWVNCFQCNKSK